MKTRILILSLLCVATVLGQQISPGVAQGNKYFRIGRYDLAEEAYNKALQSNPNDSIARYNLAITIHKQQRFDDALNTINPLIAAQPAGSLKEDAFYNQGVANTRLRNLDASIESYKSALRLDPRDVWARENLQKALLEKKQQSGGGGAQQNKGGMSQKEAQNQLKKLQQKEQEIQDKIQNNRKQTGSGQAQDW